MSETLKCESALRPPGHFCFAHLSYPANPPATPAYPSFAENWQFKREAACDNPQSEPNHTSDSNNNLGDSAEDEIFEWASSIPMLSSDPKTKPMTQPHSAFQQNFPSGSHQPKMKEENFSFSGFAMHGTPQFKNPYLNYDNKNQVFRANGIFQVEFSMPAPQTNNRYQVQLTTKEHSGMHEEQCLPTFSENDIIKELSELDNRGSVFTEEDRISLDNLLMDLEKAEEMQSSALEQKPIVQKGCIESSASVEESLITSTSSDSEKEKSRKRSSVSSASSLSPYSLAGSSGYGSFHEEEEDVYSIEADPSDEDFIPSNGKKRKVASLRKNWKSVEKRPIVPSTKTRNKKAAKLWEFVLFCLEQTEFRDVICWRDKCDGSFKLVDSTAFAQLYTSYKAHSDSSGKGMGGGDQKAADPHDFSYSSISRAFRHYYRNGIMMQQKGKKLYKFGPCATGWATREYRPLAKCSLDNWHDSAAAARLV